MIESNLAVLLAERNIRISKVAHDTGISRTTLTALCNDYTGGIKFDTLDVLCKYLNVTPTEFFNYTPYECKFVIEDKSEGNRLTYLIDIKMYLKKGDLLWDPIPISAKCAFTEKGHVDEVVITALHDNIEYDDEKDFAYVEYEKFLKETSKRQQQHLLDQLKTAVIGMVTTKIAKDKDLSKRVDKKTEVIFTTDIF